MNLFQTCWRHWNVSSRIRCSGFNQIYPIKEDKSLILHDVMTFKLKKDVYFSNKKIWLCNLQRVSAFDARGLSYLPTQIRLHIFVKANYEMFQFWHSETDVRCSAGLPFNFKKKTSNFCLWAQRIILQLYNDLSTSI